MADRRGVSLALAVVLATIVPSAASAQAIATLERKLLPFRFGPLDSVPTTFWDALTFLRDEEDRQRSLRADITFGLSGDEAGDKSLFRLNTGIGLSRGVFPSEVSVTSRVFLQRRDGELQEDLTSLQITYDYHTTHHVEFFAFAERFSDTFLSIQQRYEVGLGVRTGFEFGRSREWRNTEALFDTAEKGLTAVEAALPSVRAKIPPGAAIRPSGPHEVTPLDLLNFRTTMHDLRHALAYRQTKLFLGVAASLFSEIESASLDVTTTPAPGSSASGAVKSKVALGSRQRYRISVRPTFRLRPSREVQLTIFPYFKLPFDGPRHGIGYDGRRRLDYRRDVLSEMSWNIRAQQTGLETVELVFTFNHYYDSVPPALPASLLAETLAAGRVFDRTVAEHRHRLTALNLRLRW